MKNKGRYTVCCNSSNKPNTFESEIFILQKCTHENHLKYLPINLNSSSKLTNIATQFCYFSSSFFYVFSSI